MGNFKIALAVAVATGSFLSIASSANAAIAATGMKAVLDSLTAIEQVGNRRHCWYPKGSHGPGWYWCRGLRH